MTKTISIAAATFAVVTTLALPALAAPTPRPSA